jgi:hypothetical protein
LLGKSQSRPEEGLTNPAPHRISSLTLSYHMTHPILFETKESEKNIIPSKIVQNNSSSDNSFDNDENHDNFQTASIEKNSSIPRNDIRENDQNSPPQENYSN